MNAPDRFELFTLADGEEYFEETKDARTPNTSQFLFRKEDHTLGNMITAELRNSPKVMFAGYRVPHPLFVTIEMRIQTDGSVTPRQILMDTIKKLIGDLQTFSREFAKEVELRKLANETAGEGSSK